MTSNLFLKFLRYCESNDMEFLKENAILLRDNSTYLLHEDVFDRVKPSFMKDYEGHRILILTDQDIVVGGILFYGNYDMQVEMFPEFQGCGFMSEVHQNGIINSNLYNHQRISIDIDMIKDQDDLDMKLYLLSYLDVKIRNIKDISKWFSTSKVSKKNKK